jgi:hypothetical protein
MTSRARSRRLTASWTAAAVCALALAECSKGAVTGSATCLHQNPKANTYAGHQNVTHGRVGLATDGTAKKFYDEVVPGDVVTVVGSKDTVAVGNGYGDWNADWAPWRAGSALR